MTRLLLESSVELFLHVMMVGGGTPITGIERVSPTSNGWGSSSPIDGLTIVCIRERGGVGEKGRVDERERKREGGEQRR